MMKRFLRIALSITLVASLSLGSSAIVKSGKLDELKKQKAAASAKKNEYKKKQKEAENYISGVDKQLTSISTQIYQNGKKLTKTKKDPLRRFRRNLSNCGFLESECCVAK